MLSFNCVHECFKYNGVHYNFKSSQNLALDLVKTKASYNCDIGSFLIQWLDQSKTITLNTSGSTGVPKTITMQKRAMVNSAIATGVYFNLKPKQRALLCLPAHYIAGKMMLVRAIVLGLELDSIEPKSNLEIDINKQYQFTAMVPMQLEKNINKLNNIKTLIVGGAKVSSVLQSNLQTLKTAIFETYGMTETVSHIAVKHLNNPDNNLNFKVLPNINISQDNRNCLVVEAPNICDEKIITNDIVKVHSKNEFEWLGRFDNIINSGGLKVFPEQIENVLYHKINNRFFIASEKDNTLGERVVLVIEGKENSLNASALNDLSSYYKPKVVYYVDEFVATDSGKIKRIETLKKIKKK
ncbi:AMP-binding protein [Lacinutrix sp.]|uniref:AMP-binding protein n=1 Tax=Lacinutrix sp. TaxID=1937692 RepID=UPI0035C7C2EB